MMQANSKFVMGKLMFTVDALKQAGNSCVELNNYYINNYKKGQDIIALFKEEHFLVDKTSFSSHGPISTTFSTSTHWICL
jgi:hypothetical protein